MTETTFNPGALDMRTETERQRDEVRDEVCREFLDSYTAYPYYSPNRHMEAIALRHDLTVMGVKYMLQQRGLYRRGAGHPMIVISAEAHRYSPAI